MTLEELSTEDSKLGIAVFDEDNSTEIVMEGTQDEDNVTEFKTESNEIEIKNNFMGHKLRNISPGQEGVFNQEAQATIAINHYFHALNEWTNKQYLEIILNQNGRMNVIALPDSDRDWEPYVFMELSHSIKQRQLGLTKIAEAMARQWFGYVIYPENWRHQWVISGIATYAAYDILQDFLNYKGYYRVNYDADLWERIVEALIDPERREEIHPLNRATLVDDALNLARASKLDYGIAFQVVLTMEHETEYAVWKAFVRNMNFLRKRLVALVEENEDLDPDIYLRMVRRSIETFEDEIGFYPELNAIEPVMVSLCRGLVMDHACRANYDPCIAAAVDWFYDPNDNDVVNPNIPRDIRPAVYCTMVREGDDDVISALYDRLEIEASHYERVVILESLACSQDDGFIRTFLEETIAANSPYGVEENVRIFKAIAESSSANARLALNFISLRTNEIRNMYGGPEKLEEIIFTLADNMANANLATDFINWVESRNNNLGDSEEAAERAAELVKENLNWDSTHMDYVYEWIDENDGTTIFVSAFLITLSLFVALFNH
ncbi:unnamed protein product, partial [Iphiclides podalirius]